MKNQFLEAGQIVNTHGIQGEVKIVPWCDSPEFLLQFGTLYLDGTPVRVRAARVHKGNVLAALEGVADVNAAMALKGKTVSIDRSGVVLPEGRHFIADLLGLEVLDAKQRGEAGGCGRRAHPARPRGLRGEGRA
ncbi:ribosome maturation factor RimM [Flavonifractor plautii]|nr:ribosome maturation factor RimM [Flavonifractor plautii]